MMLKDFMKKLGGKPETPEASQEATQAGAPPEQHEEKLMSDAHNHVELAAHEAVVAELAALTEQFASFKAASEATAAAYEQKLSAYAEAEEKAKADALAVKINARNEKAVAQMGTEKAAAFMAATEDMSDEKVDAFFAIFANTAAAEANSETFKEVGASGKVDAQKDTPAVTHFNKFMQKKETK